ncbi:MAG: DUF2961 domain-containing protein [Opitutus sp.]
MHTFDSVIPRDHPTASIAPLTNRNAPRAFMLGMLLGSATSFSQPAPALVKPAGMAPPDESAQSDLGLATLVRPVGMGVLAHPEYLPLLFPAGTQTLQFSSYDLTGGNNDGNFSRCFTKYVDNNGEFVIFDAYGPGSLNRQQINLWLTRLGAGTSRIRYYFDDEATPRIDLPVDDFFGGTHAPFDSPFSFMGRFEDSAFKEFVQYRFKDFRQGEVEYLRNSSAALKTRYKDLTPTNLEPVSHKGTAFAIQYYPLPFSKRLKVTFVPNEDFRKTIASQKGPGWGSSWYQFTYLLYPQGTQVASWSKDEPASEAVRTMWSHVGDDPKQTSGNSSSSLNIAILPGATAVLLDAKGQGSIASMKLRLSPYSEEAFFGVRIRMSWDAGLGPWGGGAPSAVDMPIGVFFGGGAKDYADRSKIVAMKLATLFYGFDGSQGTFYSYWPMPYWTSAKIELINSTSQAVTITAAIQTTPVSQLNYPAGATGHFYAKQTQDRDVGDGLFASVFREQGYGHVAGISFYAEGYPWDGDEFAYFDGSRTPQIHGDGAEDDHNQGWGGAGFQQPIWGALINGIQGAYRLYLNDPYVFEDQIKINYEYSRSPIKTHSETDVTVYYYKVSVFPRLVQTDAVDVGMPESEKAHEYTVERPTWEGALRSAYDGYEKNVEEGAFREEGRAFSGHSAFTVDVVPKNEGVRLRRLLSRHDNGVQTAEVYVDGIKVDRLWHVVFNTSAPENQAWVDSDFELPATLTRGKSKIHIEVRHVASTKGELNEFHYWVLCHQPR